MGKKPLEYVLSVYTISENAINSPGKPGMSGKGFSGYAVCFVWYVFVFYRLE